MSRESYGGGGQYGMGSSSSSNASSGGGGGRDASQPDFSPPSTNNPYSGGVGGVQIGLTTPPAPPNTVTGDDSTKTKLDYITSPEYRDLFNNLSTDRQEDVLDRLDEQKKQAIYSISPMTDPKNKAIATGLTLLLGPLAGSLYGRYKDATAMGYSIQNPFEGLLGSGEITIEKVNQAIERGDGNNFNISEVVASAPSIIQGNTQQPSVAAAWYKNLGTTSGWDPFSTNSLFKNARAKQQSILGTATGIGQMAVNESPFFNFLKDNSINKGIL